MKKQSSSKTPYSSCHKLLTMLTGIVILGLLGFAVLPSFIMTKNSSVYAARRIEEHNNWSPQKQVLDRQKKYGKLNESYLKVLMISGVTEMPRSSFFFKRS